MMEYMYTMPDGLLDGVMGKPPEGKSTKRKGVRPKRTRFMAKRNLTLWFWSRCKYNSGVEQIIWGERNNPFNKYWHGKLNISYLIELNGRYY